MNNFSNAMRKRRWDWDEIIDSIFSYPSCCPQSPLSPVSNKNDSREKGEITDRMEKGDNALNIPACAAAIPFEYFYF